LWDARLQPRLGTVEVRVMDAQTSLEDTAALAEDRFLAARDGAELAEGPGHARQRARRSPRTGSTRSSPR
jgi:gamma-glutamyl:cysteine ligase YbdK (ATP-grasp superfamily)